MEFKAAELALKWCEEHTGWKRICDIEGGSDQLYISWGELPTRVKNVWGSDYDESGAKEAWEEFGRKTCKVPHGFIAEDGQFYSTDDFLKLSLNGMMIFKVSELDHHYKEDKGHGTCRICGCTDDNACVTWGDPCYWVNDEHNLCSACKLLR
ncbi:hypothetical protein AAXB25_22770 [Paenibacillus lautus]|uniref:hypothetical protein n=1 Tax=Paenibacillus lautus TaxID=1401 RepID=UPI003D2876E7